MYMYIYIYIYLSLSLYIYIYIYMHTHTTQGAPREARGEGHRPGGQSREDSELARRLFLKQC